jgi:hypothetical protein
LFGNHHWRIRRNSIRHAQVILPGIRDFKELQAGFPIKTASEMIFCETIII